MNTFPPSPKETKVVISTCFGGYSLSHEAIMEWAKRSDITLYPHKHVKYGYLNYYTSPIKDGQDPPADDYFDGARRDIERTDLILVAMVEESPGKWDGDHAELKVVEVPKDVSWEIDEYDGKEHIAETHRSWS